MVDSPAIKAKPLQGRQGGRLRQYMYMFTAGLKQPSPHARRAESPSLVTFGVGFAGIITAARRDSVPVRFRFEEWYASLTDYILTWTYLRMPLDDKERVVTLQTGSAAENPYHVALGATSCTSPKSKYVSHICSMLLWLSSYRPQPFFQHMLLGLSTERADICVYRV